MRFLVDMNLTQRRAALLSRAGHPSLRRSDIGAANAPDDAIMSYARDHDFCVITHDLDFGTILALTNWDCTSVVQIRADDASPETIGATLFRALAQSEAAIEAGALLTVEPGKHRLRVLPFRTTRGA